MPQPVDNTAGEATMTRIEAQRHGWKRVIIVTSLAHTRRTALAMRRVLGPAGIDFQVRATRYDHFQPSGWWRSRNSALNTMPMPSAAAIRNITSASAG